MKMLNSLPVKNLLRRPVRSSVLLILSLFLCFAVLAGTMTISGLQNGLKSLDARLGADIMVVPYEASTKSSLSDMFLQGNPGYFYMDTATADKIEETEGIAKSSRQCFLATAKASCCSSKLQIISFDPETDFTITPWVQHSYKGELQDFEVFVGCNVNQVPGNTMTFYGVNVTVAAMLDETGTYLDNSVYANEYTIQYLISAAQEKGFDFVDIDPDEVTSCVLIDVADGYTVDEVLNSINIYVSGVEAIKTQSLIEDVSTKLTGVADMAGVLIAVVWVLAVVIQLLVFTMLSNERKKEFAVLRVLGASRKKLAGLLLKESLLVSVAGSVLGCALGVLVSELFSSLIENMLSMPFLLPSGAGLALVIVCSLAASVLAGSLSAAACAWRISRLDAAVILRGDN